MNTSVQILCHASLCFFNNPHTNTAHTELLTHQSVCIFSEINQESKEGSSVDKEGSKWRKIGKRKPLEG